MKRWIAASCVLVALLSVLTACSTHEHTWAEATCTTPKTCTECGATEGSALGHAFDTTQVIVELTCGQDGVVEGVCSRCGETVTETTPATGNHDVQEWTTATAATCSAAGEEQGTCAICGATVTRPVEKLAHTDDNTWVIAKAATETKAGTRETHCKVCGAVVQSESYELTTEEKNALRSAKSYISLMDFSRKGLISQLEFEGFSHEAAVMAVDSLDVDWNEEAAQSAKSYMDLFSFSRKQLIEQLLFEGFTQEQAEYGAKAVGY